MTNENELTEEDLENFSEKTKEEKLSVLRRLADNTGLLDDFNVKGDVTVRVLDEDGEEKHFEKKSFEY